MSWFSKPKKPESVAAAAPRAEMPKPDPEKQLSALLSDYEKQFYDKVRDAADRDAEEAKKLVAAARRFVSESRLGYALARPLLGHVQYWPEWSKREDFGKYANGPFRYIDGSRSDQKPRTTIVSFAYNSVGYTLKFIDTGMSEWVSDDLNTYGKVELIQNETIVLGLDISKDLSKNDAGFWDMHGVYALRG